MKTSPIRDPGDNRLVRSRRSLLMAANKGVSTRFMESFRAVLEDLDEVEKYQSEAVDPVGEQLTSLLNKCPEFQSPSSNYNGTAEEEARSFQPLLSSKNLNRMKLFLSRMKDLAFSDPHKRLLSSLAGCWKFLFGNRKSLLWSCVLFLELSFIVLTTSAATLTVASIVSLRIFYVVFFFILSVLVDLKELYQLLPEAVRGACSKATYGVFWFDSVALNGKRFRGREWHRDSFVLGDAKSAQSTSTYLWRLPPPSARPGKRLSLDLGQLQRDEWSTDTAEHVAAVDFCYSMLRDDFVERQYAKLRSAVLKKQSDPVLSTSQSNGDTITYTRKIKQTPTASSAASTKELSVESRSRRNSLEIDTFSELDEGGAAEELTPSLASPTDAIEVVRERRILNMEVCASVTDDVSRDTTSRDVNFTLLNDILEDEMSHELPLSPGNARESSTLSNSDVTTDLNWMDVGAEIGMKLLGSAAVQKAMASQEAAERIFPKKLANSIRNLKEGGAQTPEPLSQSHTNAEATSQKTYTTPLTQPVHSMWTSASAAARTTFISPSNTSDSDSISHDSNPRQKRIQEERDESSLSPISPDSTLVLTYSSENFDPNSSGLSRLQGAENSFSSMKRIHRRHLLRGPSGPVKPQPDETEARPQIEMDGMVGNDSKLRSADSSSPKPKSGTTRPRNLESIEVVCDDKKTVTPKTVHRRPLLLPGVKIAAPIFPLQPGSRPSKRVRDSHFQMATVLSSKRILVSSRGGKPTSAYRGTNCLSVTVNLDKSFLRNGEFAELTFRIMDHWGPRYMPKHSKLPLGSCVATSFGLGVLVGWRVEDDAHVVRSLWERRGPGSACAYLNRNAIHSTIEASIGFSVRTTFGRGKVVAYVDGGREFRSGVYFVSIKEEGRHKGRLVEMDRGDILACRSAQFIPVVEHIRDAAQYQLQLDNYKAALRASEEGAAEEPLEGKVWRDLSKYSDILWKSLLRAIEEDDEFDEGMNDFVASFIKFLDRLDSPNGSTSNKGNDDANLVITTTQSSDDKLQEVDKYEPRYEPTSWLHDVLGIFGGQVQGGAEPDSNESIEVECTPTQVSVSQEGRISKSYDRAFAVIQTLMRTVSMARAACKDEPNFKLTMSICYELLLFVKTVIKVQQKNVSPHSLQVWRRAWEEIVTTFGPVKERLEKIGHGIAERMEKQGRRAKVRLLRFVDTIVQDDILLLAIEQGDWNRCGEQVENAMVKARIMDEENRELYHKTAQFLYNHFAVASSRSKSAAARNNEKLAHLALAVRWIAAPRKLILKLFQEDWVLDLLERVLVRVFHNEDVASRMLSIHASNFQTLRQFRMLKDFTIAGKLWIPLLDAADAEFSWAVSRMPDNAKEYMGPLSSLFSLCVVQFHKISEGDLTKDWLDFLMDEEAVEIVHDIDMKLILALESFSQDVREMMVVLPYYPSIEDDILKLVDEVDIDEFLKEASSAIEDAQKLSDFIREKATSAIERFLDYVPKMSIPVEKRDLADGWVLTCRGEDGGDLTLTDLTIKRENLTCQVMGGDTLFFPMIGGEEDIDCMSTVTSTPAPPAPYRTEVSVLDHIRDMILQAQRYGCWKVGVGGVSQPPSDRYVASVLDGLPVSSVLNCAIELWRNLEIDDDELLEIAIRDVSYQIQLHGERENGEGSESSAEDNVPSAARLSRISDASEVSARHRFNPRVDPTVLFLEVKKLTFHLDKFLFRIEKNESRRTVFDPVFEGSGSLMVQNVSITLRVECLKEYVAKMGSEFAVPVLELRELDVQLEKVKLKVKDTGADWFLNKVVKGFEDNISKIMAANLRDQVREQIDLALQNLNGYFEVNPELMLGILGITMDDLEEKVVWV